MRLGVAVARLSNKKLVRAFVIGSSTALLVFIILNLALFLIFKNQTYPNTYADKVKIGAVSYTRLNSVLSKKDPLEAKITLAEQGSKVNISVYSLGVKENLASMSQQLKQRSWLPLSNLLSRHMARLSVTVNSQLLNKQLNSIANLYNKAAVDAKVNLINGQFVLDSDASGYSLNIGLAAANVTKAIEADNAYLSLPINKTEPPVTASSIAGELDNLKAQQSISIAYSYNGKTTKANPSDMANWYSLSGTSYEPSSSKIENYIKGIGQSDGIVVANISGAVAATEAALQNISPLNFTLTAIPNTPCIANGLSQVLIVSISHQHLWACNDQTSAYDSSVVTGDEQYADTLTPPGTYHIYAKETSQTLVGHDENGSWSDFVSYWMPFLYNQYGAYGFHDATWRPDSAFGNIDINTPQASNGCVELPLPTAKWLYNWVNIGTTVKIQS